MLHEPIVIGILIFLIFVVPIIGTIIAFSSRKQDKIAREYEGSEEKESLFVKKYREANIHQFRNVYLLVGYTVVLGILLVLFTFTPREDDVDPYQSQAFQDEIIVEPPVTSQPPPQPPPPPPPPEIKEVEDDPEKEEDPPDIFDQELDDDEIIPDIPPPPPPEPKPDQPKIFRIVEDMPEFPGGDAALFKYLAENIEYPRIARENNIEGIVHMRFVVDEKGEIGQIEILRHPGGGTAEEAKRVVKDMPTWKPGKQRGKPVKVYYQLPVRFTLTN